MKSFPTTSFGALTSLFVVLATVQAAVLPRDGILPPTNLPTNLIPEYFKLMDKCNADDTTVCGLDPTHSVKTNVERISPS
jgi:hypothetical protein